MLIAQATLILLLKRYVKHLSIVMVYKYQYLIAHINAKSPLLK